MGAKKGREGGLSVRKEVAPGPDWMALSLSTKHASVCSPLKEEPQTVAPGQSLSTFQEELRGT